MTFIKSFSAFLLFTSVFSSFVFASAGDSSCNIGQQWQFLEDDSDYRPTVLWFWQDVEMTPGLAAKQLDEMKHVGFRDVMIFPLGFQPRFYTPEWYDVIEAVLLEAKKRDMRIWLTNDDRVPAGRGADLVIKGGKAGSTELEPRPDLKPKYIINANHEIAVDGPVDIRALCPEKGEVPPALSVEDNELIIRGGGLIFIDSPTDLEDFEFKFEAVPETTYKFWPPMIKWALRDPASGDGYIWSLRASSPLGGKSFFVQESVKDGKIEQTRAVELKFEFIGGSTYSVATSYTKGGLSVTVNDNMVFEEKDQEHAGRRLGFDGRLPLRLKVKKLSIEHKNDWKIEKEFVDESALDIFVTTFDADKVKTVSAIPIGSEGPQYENIVDLGDHFHSSKMWNPMPGLYKLVYVAVNEYKDLIDPWYGNLLNEEVGKRFVQANYEPFYERFAWAFGDTFMGFWDDEAHIPAVQEKTPWSDSLVEMITYSGLTPGKVLPALFEDYGRYGRIARGIYWKAVMDCWSNCWYRPQGQWTKDHGVEMISNPLGDDTLPAMFEMFGGSLPKNNQWFSIPGTDAIFDQVLPGKRFLIPRYATSSSHQAGNRWSQAELFGGYGWWVEPKTYRFVTGSTALRGSNLFVLHAFWANYDKSLEKVPFPPPFDPSNPWWFAMPELVKWTSRLNQFNTGDVLSSCALMIPQRSIESHYGLARYGTAANIDEVFRQAMITMENVQVDFDLLDESSLDGDRNMHLQAIPKAGKLCIGPQKYSVVVIPNSEVMAVESARRLGDFIKGGGKVIFYNTIPDLECMGLDEHLGEKVQIIRSYTKIKPSASGGWCVLCKNAEDLKTALTETKAGAVTVEPYNENIRVLRRRNQGHYVYILMNEAQEPAEIDIEFQHNTIPLKINPDTGQVRRVYKLSRTANGLSLPLKMEPFEVAAFAFSENRSNRIEGFCFMTECEPAVLGMDVRGREIAAQLLFEKPGPYTLKAQYEGHKFQAVYNAGFEQKTIDINSDWEMIFEDKPKDFIKTDLGDFSKVRPDYSGSVYNINTFDIPHGLLKEENEWFIELGKVHEACEFWINGWAGGKLLYKPYRAEVTKLLKPGKNQVKIRTANTLANRFGDVKESGLFGPVVIKSLYKTEVILSRGEE